MRLPIIALALLMAIIGGVAMAQYSTTNYSEQGGARWVVGGELVTEQSQSLKQANITVHMPATDTNGDVAYAVSPVSGTITRICGVAGTGTNSATVVSLSIAGVYVSNGSVTIPAVSATAPQSACVVTTISNTVDLGTVIRAQSNGAPTTSGTAALVITINRF